MTHLWWNGYEHSHGETEEEASLNYQHLLGCSADDAEGDGWQMVPDDALMADEEACNPDGTCRTTGETAAQYAKSLAAQTRAVAGDAPGEGTTT